VGKAENVGAYACVGSGRIWEASVTSLQFAMNLKLLLKNSRGVGEKQEKCQGWEEYSLNNKSSKYIRK